jgi:hypothetical protein
MHFIGVHIAMYIIQRNLKKEIIMNNKFYYIFSILGVFTLFSIEASCMEDENPLNFPRVQIFTINKAVGGSAHDEFEKKAAVTPIIKHYPAFLLERTGEGLTFGQLVCKDEEDAKSLYDTLRLTEIVNSEATPPVFLNKGQLSVGETHKKIDYLMRHNWSQ